MNLKDTGFPYKRYERKKLDVILQFIQGNYLDFDILEGADHYFVAEKKKKLVIDNYASNRKGLAPTSSNWRIQQGKVALTDDQIDQISHDLRFEQTIRKDDSFVYNEIVVFHWIVKTISC